MTSPRVSHLQEHFQDLEQQTHAARLGMWLAIASEILLFGGLFTLYASYRLDYGDAFREAARHTALPLGTTMTYLLITSSLSVALAVQAARRSAMGACGRWLMASILLGIAFLGLKGWEWAEHLRDGIAPGIYYSYPGLEGAGAKVFFTLYYLMTGLHALHVIAGIGLLGFLAWGARRRRWGAEYSTPVELGGMYWHLVDVVWVFLWPMFYLLR